jgi:hypothetical protein
MKQFIAALLLISLTAQAQPLGAGNELARPTADIGQASLPIPDLVMRGQFDLPKERVKTVVVRGYGDTPTLARYDGFRTAIEHVVGVSLVSETQINNQRLQRDQIASYSQARVSSFHVLNLEQTRQGWSTQMWVTVRDACERGSTNCLN